MVNSKQKKRASFIDNPEDLQYMIDKITGKPLEIS